MTANEQDSRVAVVHECFPERGNSVLTAFSWTTIDLVANQPGCASARIHCCIIL